MVFPPKKFQVQDCDSSDTSSTRHDSTLTLLSAERRNDAVQARLKDDKSLLQVLGYPDTGGLGLVGCPGLLVVMTTATFHSSCVVVVSVALALVLPQEATDPPSERRPLSPPPPCHRRQRRRPRPR